MPLSGESPPDSSPCEDLEMMTKSFESALKSLLPRFVEHRREAKQYHTEMRLAVDKHIRLLGDFVRHKTFIDVGANSGSYLHHLKRHARRVVAFEPIASTADRIRRFNPSVEVHTCALSDVSGQLILHVPHLDGAPVLTRCSLNSDANPGFETRPQAVEVRRLDEFRIQNVGALKIDVEGHELRVILGAEETIASSKPVLLVEIEERHHPGRSLEIIDRVRRLGYDCYYFDIDDELVDANHFDFRKLQNPANLKHPFRDGCGIYINDFVFFPQKH
jgi:FkbM family methyltransferase